MITQYEEFAGERESFGSKALRLFELSSAQYPVPPFVVITTKEVLQMCQTRHEFDTEKVQEFVMKITDTLPCARYAVRSATLAEDQAHSAHAGQFKTELNVSPDDLFRALISVITDAQTKLQGVEGACSLIIQEYIEPDYAGVLFTRNPIQGREMVLEYRAGRGDAVVGGASVQKLQFLYPNVPQEAVELKNLGELVQHAHAIECKYDFPQDIEWAIKDSVVYILQTRPITSITPALWKGFLRIEAELKNEKNFYYEKTSLSETFPHPRPLAHSLLMELYGANGPIKESYAHLGVQYGTSENLFRLFGNELLVNKEIETKTLFPSFGHMRHASEAPRFESFRGIFVTLKNMWALSRISLESFGSLSVRLETLLGEARNPNTLLPDRIAQLKAGYTTIFTINVVAQKALTKLEHVLGKDTVHLSALLEQRSRQIPQRQTHKNLEKLIGNSLNIDDVSAFVSQDVPAEKYTPNETTDAWWQSLPSWKKIGLAPHIERARQYMELRESARVLTVQLVHSIRESVEKIGNEIFHHAPDLVYFATIQELIDGTVHLSICEERKREYEANMQITMPSYIASFVKQNTQSSKPVGISSGTAEGTIVTKETIATVSGNKILYTEILSPDLVEHFPHIVGIVSENGGMLSHLAIMAREAHIPVIVINSSAHIKLNSHARIDGSTGDFVYM